MSAPTVNNRATFIAFGMGGVGHYRAAMPASALGEGLFIRDDKTLKPLKLVGELEASVIVYSQPFLDFQIEECEQILASNRKLVIDVDDDLRSCLGKTDLMIDLDERMVERQEELMQKAHLVTCSTQHIADSIRRRLGVQTAVCPNAIDLDRFNIQKFPRNRQATIIGWAGGVGHLEALERIAPAIESVMDAREDVAFVSIGSPSPEFVPSSLLGKYADSMRVGDGGWLPLYDYPVMLSQFHIGLCPAVDNDFYRGKSDNKFLEQAAGYVATIGQEPTYNAIKTGDDETGLLLPADASADDWHGAIMELVADPKRRYTMTKRARKYVATHRTMDQTAAAWKAAIDRAEAS